MTSMHVRCLMTALGLAIVATLIPAIAAAMTLLGVLGLVGAAGFVLREWFEIEPQDAEASPAPPPKAGVPAHWV